MGFGDGCDARAFEAAKPSQHSGVAPLKVIFSLGLECFQACGSAIARR